jgi:hypothetical protein
MKRYEAADDVRNKAIFSQTMARYDLCLALDKADPRRKQTADQAIEALKQWDNNDSEVQPVVRNRMAKLSMAKGDYAGAKKGFATVINNPNAEIKPAPNLSQQYEARYFSVVCDILSRKLNEAQKEIDALEAWQNANPMEADVKGDAARKSVRDGVTAALAMLHYRLSSGRADIANDADDRKKNNDQAVATLMQLLKDQPQYRAVIFQQVATRLPEDAPVANLEPLLLLAVQQQGEQEYARPEGQKIDQKVMDRAIDAAREIIKRKPGGGLDTATISRSAYVLPYLLERSGRPQEATAAFLDYAENNKTDLKNANDALDHATNLIGQLRKKDMEDQETRKLYDRFLPLAIRDPFNRKQFAFEYGLLLQREQHYKQAVELFRQVPADDKRILSAQFYQMVALKQRLNDDNDKMDADERKSVMNDVQSLADQVNTQAAAALSSAASPEEKTKYNSMLVRTALLAADLASREQRNPKRTLDLLNGFEDKVKGSPNEQDLLFEALALRVNSYMELGKTNDATSTLVQLLNTKQGDQGPALVFDLLKKLDTDMDRARAAGDMAEVRQLAQNRATLSGFLVTWAEDNQDPKIKTLAPRYKVFDASTKELAAELTDDPAAKKAGLEAALKQYQDLADAKDPNPQVALGLGFVQFDLGNYKAAKDALGPLITSKKVGTPVVQITENGEPKDVENTQYWEAHYKLLRAIVEDAKQKPNDAQAQSDLEAAKGFLKRLYVQWPQTIGGKKYHDDFERLRAEIVPDFHPEQLIEPAASQPVASQ